MYKFDDIKVRVQGTLKKVSGTCYFQVDEEYIFDIYNNYKVIGTITIPTGFITDFGSIPRFLWNFDKSRYISYIYHDYLYNTMSFIKFSEYNKQSIDRCLTRSESDYLLGLGLENEKMNALGVLLVRIGLFIGGVFNYKKLNNIVKEIKQFEENENNITIR